MTGLRQEIRKYLDTCARDGKYPSDPHSPKYLRLLGCAVDALETLDRREGTPKQIELALEQGVIFTQEGFNVSGMRLTCQWTWKHKTAGSCGGYGTQGEAAKHALLCLDAGETSPKTGKPRPVRAAGVEHRLGPCTGAPQCRGSFFARLELEPVNGGRHTSTFRCHLDAGHSGPCRAARYYKPAHPPGFRTADLYLHSDADALAAAMAIDPPPVGECVFQTGEPTRELFEDLNPAAVSACFHEHMRQMSDPIDAAVARGVRITSEGSWSKGGARWDWAHPSEGVNGSFDTPELAARDALKTFDQRDRLAAARGKSDPIRGSAAYDRVVVSRATDRGVTFETRFAFSTNGQRWTWKHEGYGGGLREGGRFRSKVEAAEDALEKLGPRSFLPPPFSHNTTIKQAWEALLEVIERFGNGTASGALKRWNVDQFSNLRVRDLEPLRAWCEEFVRPTKSR